MRIKLEEILFVLCSIWQPFLGMHSSSELHTVAFFLNEKKIIKKNDSLNIKMIDHTEMESYNMNQK